MLRNGYAIILLMLLLGVIPSVAAEKVVNMYRVSVPVENQQQSQQKKALATAMQELMLRVTGSAEAVDNPTIKAALRQPQSYVQQFGYITETDPLTNQPLLKLRVSFQPVSINNLVRQASLPLWTSNRPNVLIWLALDESAFDDGKPRALVSGETHAVMVQAIRQRARQRAVPISFPLLDLEDSFALGADDVWQLHPERLFNASQRYRSDAILAGRILHTTSNQWIGNWWFSYQGKTVEFSGKGLDMASYVADGIDAVADHLAQQYAIQPGNDSAGGMILVVDGIGDYPTYTRVFDYLQHIVAVRQVTVARVENDQVSFQLQIEGELETLQRVIALDKKLQVFQPEADQSDDDADYQPRLYYRWSPASAALDRR